MIPTKFLPVLAVLYCFSLFSCTNGKQMAYFQDLGDTTKMHTVNTYPYEPVKLQPNDQVQIIISSASPEATQFFNLMTSVKVSGVEGISSQSSFQNVYPVDMNGFITMPVLGDLNAVGLTTEELKNKLMGLLKDYLKEPIVSVRLMNFKVTIIGEVTRPQVIPVDGEKINVLQALGLAGDMSIYGNRVNVKVMRNINDSMQVGFLNFNTSKSFQSPFFQLRQNDVVYVEPYKTKSLRSESFSFWVPIILSVVTTITLIAWRLGN